MMYENMTDAELIREFDNRGGDALTAALAERLDMRQQTSVFTDVAEIMRKKGVPCGIEEHDPELTRCAVDALWLTIEMSIRLGLPLDTAWEEHVYQQNRTLYDTQKI